MTIVSASVLVDGEASGEVLVLAHSAVQTIEALEQLKRWEPLLAALRQRADQAIDEDARRQDLVRIAKVVAATVDEEPDRAHADRLAERTTSSIRSSTPISGG